MSDAEPQHIEAARRLLPGRDTIRGVDLLRYPGTDGYNVMGRGDGEHVLRTIPWSDVTPDEIAGVELVIVRLLADPPTLANPWPEQEALDKYGAP